MTRLERRQRLLKKMADMPNAVRSAMKQALAESADEITDMQRRLAPSSRRGTHGNPPGELRRSIKQTWGGGKVSYSPVAAGGSVDGDPDLTVTLSAGNANVRYAHLVEFGTSPHVLGGIFAGAWHPGTAPQPFFFPPYRALRRRAKSRVTRATKKAVQRVAGQS